MEEKYTLAPTLGLIGGVLVLLAAATAVLEFLRRRRDTGIDPAILETFRIRVRAWWMLTAALAAAVLIGPIVTVVLFGALGFWALREFITLTPTRPGDHRTLFWVFFLFTPLQFLLVVLQRYGLYSILIPVYVFLFIPARIAMSGDAKRFLERTAKIQAGILICVYCLSYAPALMTMKLPDRDATAEKGVAPASADLPEGKVLAESDKERPPRRWLVDVGASARLLLFFVLMVQLSDVLQYAWAHLPSKHVIVPTINPHKTWEGLLGGTASVTLIGSALWWATPLRNEHWWMAGLISAVIAQMGFAGAITMSAIKRDRGVKDYGTLVEGHGGVLDRIDSLCFAAPVVFQLIRYYLILTGFPDPVGR